MLSTATAPGFLARASAALLAAAALLLPSGCSDGSSPHPPFIAASVVGFTQGAGGAGLAGGASVFVLDDATGEPILGATVTVNGSTLPYDPGVLAYEGLAAILPGAPVSVSVVVGGTTYAASATQFSTYPTLTSPAANATWSGLEAQAVGWTPGAPADGALYAVGVADAADPDGALLWPAGDGFLVLAASASSAQIPPGSLSAGERAVLVGILAERPYPGAAPGSGIFLAGFDVSPIQVEVGTPVASGPGPSGLLVAGDRLVWGDDEEPVKVMPSTGGAVTVALERQPFPESARAAGGYLYWISGAELRRSALDGTATEVLATGQRDPSSTCTDVVVDGGAAYWVNTLPGACSPACEWAIVKVPLGGGAPAVLATAQAEVLALAGDADTLYWEQLGIGPVSEDGNAPTDSGIWAVPKAGGPAVLLVNGYQNGPPPVLPPGMIPASWRGVGGLALLGADLFFGDTNSFDRYRLLRVPVTGGAVAVVQEVVTGDASLVARAMAADGSTLYWIDTTSVRATPAAGGAVTTLSGGLYQGTGLAVAGGRVAWSELECCAVRQNGSVRAVPVGGGPVATLASGLDNPASLSSDGTSAFWVEGGPYGRIEGYGRIAAVPLAGGAASTVLAALFADRPRLASDGASVFLADGWRVKRVAMDGGPLETALAAGNPIVDVATDGQHVYALDATGSVLRAPVGGGAPEVLASGAFATAPPLRVAGGRAYWIEGGALRSVDTAGGAVAELASGLPAVSDLVVGPSSAFFAEQASGAIREVPLGGGTPALVAAGLPAPTVRLATDGTRLYWIDPLHIGRVSLADGSALVIATGLATDPAIPGEVAVDAAALYWTETGTGTIKRSEVR